MGEGFCFGEGLCVALGEGHASTSHYQVRERCSKFPLPPRLLFMAGRFIEAQAHAQAALAGPSEDDLRRQQLQEVARAAEAEALGMPGTGQDGSGGGGRQLSLVEQHQKKMRDEERKRKKAKKAQAAAPGAKGKVSDPEWRPWDRERDLEIKPKAFQLTKDGYAGGLSSRFGGSSSGSRSFL